MVSHISRDGVLIDVTRVPPYLTWQSYKKYSITQAFRDFFAYIRKILLPLMRAIFTFKSRNFFIQFMTKVTIMTIMTDIFCTERFLEYLQFCSYLYII